MDTCNQTELDDVQRWNLVGTYGCPVKHNVVTAFPLQWCSVLAGSILVYGVRSIRINDLQEGVYSTFYMSFVAVSDPNAYVSYETEQQRYAQKALSCIYAQTANLEGNASTEAVLQSMFYSTMIEWASMRPVKDMDDGAIALGLRQWRFSQDAFDQEVAGMVGVVSVECQDADFLPNPSSSPPLTCIFEEEVPRVSLSLPPMLSSPTHMSSPVTELESIPDDVVQAMIAEGEDLSDVWG